jgi:hypothetical protein
LHQVPPNAYLLTGTARLRSRTTIRGAHARIAAEQAQTYAALRLPVEADPAFERAEQAISDLTPGDCVGLYSDWSQARLRVYAGTCRLLLGRAQKAIDVLEKAVTTLELDPGTARPTALGPLAS